MRQRSGFDLSSAEKSPGKACFQWFLVGRFRPGAPYRAIFVLKALMQAVRVIAVVLRSSNIGHIGAWNMAEKIFFIVVGDRGSGKHLRRKIQQLFQPRPLEAWARVYFSSGCDVLMASHMCDGVVKPDVPAQIGQL